MPETTAFQLPETDKRTSQRFNPRAFVGRVSYIRNIEKLFCLFQAAEEHIILLIFISMMLVMLILTVQRLLAAIVLIYQNDRLKYKRKQWFKTDK